MDRINLGPCNFFELAQTEQDISDPCVMSVRQARSRNTRKHHIKQIPGHLHDVMHCIVLHQINSPQLVLMYVMFLPQWYAHNALQDFRFPQPKS